MSESKIRDGFIAIREYHKDYHCHWSLMVIFNLPDLRQDGMYLDLDDKGDILRLNYYYALYDLIPQIDDKILTIRDLVFDLFKIWKETSNLWYKREDEQYIKPFQSVPYTYWDVTFDKIEELLHFREHPRLKAHYQSTKSGNQETVLQ